MTSTVVCNEPAPLRLRSIVRARTAPQRFVVGLLFAFAFVCMSGRASARRAGIGAEGCDGCHTGGKTPEVTITSTASTIALRQMITLTISVSATNGAVAGFYIMANGVGTFQVVDTGTRLEGTVGVTHNAPRTGTGGQTTFTVGWTAPAEIGGVQFSAYAISGNGDGRTSGDGPGSTSVSFPIGCATGTTYYRDFDGDGYGGLLSGTLVSCVQTPFYGKMGGDCDDNSENVNPGAAEICDLRDNDCNGQIDENLTIKTYCQDDDGDGHGAANGKMMQACAPPRGYGACDNDCNDADKAIFPGAPELCNNRDDNCVGGVDENARVECGKGWCRRYGAGCNATSPCTPGKPMKESCNLFDDDCDGVDDNGTNLELCGDEGLTCSTGKCVPGGGPVPPGAGGSESTGASGSASTGGGGSGTGGDTGGSVDGSGGDSPGAAGGDQPSMNADSGGGCASSGRAPGSGASPIFAGLLALVGHAARRRRVVRARGRGAATRAVTSTSHRSDAVS